MYGNDSVVLNPDCFGPKYVKRLNQFSAITHAEEPGMHFIQILGICYQMYYMVQEQCKITETINDLFLFCWNQGCEVEKIGQHFEKNWLYMTRAIIDAAIVWYEGIPTEMAKDISQWHDLGRQTGESIAQILQHIFAFVP